ncbi:uncharacterized protein EDB91DRAFT_1350636 [Suillus paluster]|uniref:uncharacterized protein n=1 Tax=Suillus paluster TaxID=48578 RepID=UPI001B875151|nr:uncharacterized protein EDB91DRAFT_1350636 [Suillus paluster]KAG1725796.1 hypothetical protein EDB91DRAFT_1350636 [Suillus paluster]
MHTYRGHRADSFVPLDVLELNELRARNRTFNGCSIRVFFEVSLSSLTFSMMTAISFPPSPAVSYNIEQSVFSISFSPFSFSLSGIFVLDIHGMTSPINRKPVLSISKRSLPSGRKTDENMVSPFITAGRDVVAIGALVMVVEILLLAFVLQM